MANEIRAREVGATGTFYYLIYRISDNFIYNGTTFVAYNGSNYAAQYARQEAAPSAQGDYVKDFPALSDGSYDVKIRERLGASPAETDGYIGKQTIEWKSNTALDNLSLANYVDTVETVLSTVQNYVDTLETTLASGVTLADGAISSDKIADGTLTAAKFAAGSIKKNTAFNNFPFVMIDTSGNPATGKIVTAQRRIDGGTFGSCANDPEEVGNGAYDVDLAAGDLNGNAVTFRFSASGCRPTLLTIFPQP